MSLKITNGSVLEKHCLTLDSDGVRFYNGTLTPAKHFRFNQIEGVLLSANHTLSFQVENEVFSIPTQPGDADHKNAIDFLLQEVRRSTE